MYEIAQGYERFVLQSLYCMHSNALFRYYLDSQEPVQLSSVDASGNKRATFVNERISANQE